MNISNLRYERKFRIEGLNKHEVEILIKTHPAIFSEIYYQRQINNIYFDTDDYKNYFDNSAGISNRSKNRIRWYGNLLGFISSPILEIKIKENMLGKKIRFPLKPFILDKNFSIKEAHKIFEKSNIPKPLLEELKNLNFSLLNFYLRKYFISTDKKYNLTLDTNMEFINLNRENPYFLRRYKDKAIILEMKYSSEDDSNAQLISNKFPFRITKNSKYVCGINLLKHNYILT